MNLEEAVNKARDFIEEEGGYEDARLVSVRKKGKEWHIKLDVGVFSDDIRYIIIDDKSEKIIAYEEDDDEEDDDEEE